MNRSRGGYSSWKLALSAVSDCTRDYDGRLGHMNSIKSVPFLLVKKDGPAPVRLFGFLRAFDPGQNIETGLEVEPVVVSEKFSHRHAKLHGLYIDTRVIKWNTLQYVAPRAAKRGRLVAVGWMRSHTHLSTKPGALELSPFQRPRAYL